MYRTRQPRLPPPDPRSRLAPSQPMCDHADNMKTAKLVCASVLGSMLLVGCATYEQVGPRYVIGDDKVIEYAKYTNPVAGEILKTFNSSELATELGGPLRIEDYLVRLDPDRTSDIVRLEYTLRKQVGVHGCPQHFTVLLNTRTGETNVHKGE